MREDILTPAAVYSEYERDCAVKESLGKLGITGQARVNERFFVGDQWHGADCGGTRPLVSRNIIKRIGEYKIAAVSAAPVYVNFVSDGVCAGEAAKAAGLAAMREDRPAACAEEEINGALAVMSGWFSAAAERTGLERKKVEALRGAYISGTGVAFVYWDPSAATGLYADRAKTAPIRGDIALEVPDISRVNFGDPYSGDLQSQPYITVSAVKPVSAVLCEAKAHGASRADLERIEKDGEIPFGGGERTVTVITRFYKKPDETGTPTVFACRTAKDGFVRREWNTGLRLYPFAKLEWEPRRGSAYGESEITYLIPNQIAINRALTAEVWAMMMCGMPTTVVNADLVQGEISNVPGQVIKVACGFDYSVSDAVTHLTPPVFEKQYRDMINSLCEGTLADAGANQAALGELTPNNAAAITALREAAMAPLAVCRGRFYAFIEDLARVFAEFWLRHYGCRPLPVKMNGRTEIYRFDASRYADLPLRAVIDAGAATSRGESAVIAALDRLLDAGHITLRQYLERLPAGLVPDTAGLLRETEGERKQ